MNKKMMIVAGLLAVGVILLAGLTAYAVVVLAGSNNQEDHPFTINGRYTISEIRTTVSCQRSTVRGNLVTLGFDPSQQIYPVTSETTFTIRYQVNTTGFVVFEESGKTIDDLLYMVYNPTLTEATVISLLYDLEQVRLLRTGTSLDFDRQNRLYVVNANDIIYQGVYTWLNHNITVSVTDPEATTAPGNRFRHHLFFDTNETITQGSNCRRIIVRESVREQGSIEFLFGARCPASIPQD